MSATLHARARQVRTRAAVRAWEYRQRHLAGGVWGRLRRLLAGVQAAFVIPCEVADELLQEGYAEAPAGAELEPALRIIAIPAERVARVAGARQVEVRLSAELLTARCLAVVPFPSSGG